MSTLQSQLAKLQANSGVYTPTQEMLQSKLLIAPTLNIKEHTMPQFKCLTAQWAKSSPLMRKELEKDLKKLGWTRIGIAWVHETDFTIY